MKVVRDIMFISSDIARTDWSHLYSKLINSLVVIYNDGKKTTRSREKSEVLSSLSICPSCKSGEAKLLVKDLNYSYQAYRDYYSTDNFMVFNCSMCWAQWSFKHD